MRDYYINSSTVEVLYRNKRASLFNTKESYRGKSFVASAKEKQVEKRAFCDFCYSLASDETRWKRRKRLFLTRK
jgi:hypothetical protein